MNAKKQTLGKIVQEYRLRMGWTQEELSYNAGISRAQIGRIERDECTPTMGTVIRLADSFSIPHTVLLEFIQGELPPPETVQEMERAICKFQHAVVMNMTETQLQHISEALDAISSAINR